MPNAEAFLQEILVKFGKIDISFVPMQNLQLRERDFFMGFMPEARTAIVIHYPVKHLSDWTWYCPSGESGKERCAIDDRAKEICDYIEQKLSTDGIKTRIVPYPGESGLQFRFVALAAGVGQIGRNAFFLHPEWGAWVHLRVLASEMETELVTTIKTNPGNICRNCFECVRYCPAEALKQGFNGVQCRVFRRLKGEYLPFGKNGMLGYCTTCFTVCRAGKRPKIQG